jgi:hypothetical protein
MDKSEITRWALTDGESIVRVEVPTNEHGDILDTANYSEVSLVALRFIYNEHGYIAIRPDHRHWATINRAVSKHPRYGRVKVLASW